MEELEWEVLTSCRVGGREGKLTHNTCIHTQNYSIISKQKNICATCQLGSIQNWNFWVNGLALVTKTQRMGKLRNKNFFNSQQISIIFRCCSLSLVSNLF